MTTSRLSPGAKATTIDMTPEVREAISIAIDRASLKEGGATTRTLEFWMKERGIKGDGLADNVHFDDGANHRIVLWYGTDLKDKVAALVQGTSYKVTFTYAAGDELVYGTMTAVE